MISCRWCGKEFVKTISNKMACSKKCAYLSYRHNGKSMKEVYKPKKCIYCGKIFEYNEKNKMQFSNMQTCGREECKEKLRFGRLSKDKEGFEHTRKRRDKINMTRRNWKKRFREEFIKMLGGKCLICNFDKFLHVHHRKEKNREYKDHFSDWRDSIKRGTHEGEFMLLCPNHHAIHTYLKIPIEDLN